MTAQVTTMVAVAVSDPAASERLSGAIIELVATPAMIGAIRASGPAFSDAMTAQLAREHRGVLPVNRRHQTAKRTVRPQWRDQAACIRAARERGEQTDADDERPRDHTASPSITADGPLAAPAASSQRRASPRRVRRDSTSRRPRPEQALPCPIGDWPAPGPTQSALADRSVAR